MPALRILPRAALAVAALAGAGPAVQGAGPEVYSPMILIRTRFSRRPSNSP